MGLLNCDMTLVRALVRLRSNVTVSVNTWYTVKANRTAETGHLIVNDGSPVSVTSPGSAVALDVNSHFYLGGVRMLSYVNSKAVDNDPSSVQDFSGCIDHFEVNGNRYFQPSTGALEEEILPTVLITANMQRNIKCWCMPGDLHGERS
ncbi:Basement membrane-specific heparan sulfate proteoglycan core protein [Desmophyllum pertusum]|uniref:Basement membrane-specific heparan sulfate proteoglycan core protein n=1 Tax=Desmophyllum pertusum TaxID=174260 RepID=A0A9W9Y7E5_9CNID|nr:Basement membrane-specific heparan sulfate proteoglycan core protein [Desmophyllum pertusum]